MAQPPVYRAGTTSVTLPGDLDQQQLSDGLREALCEELARTGEWLDRFDFGPPRRAADGRRSYAVMFRTGPPAAEPRGPESFSPPPQLDA